MQFVLNHQVGRRQSFNGQRATGSWIAGAIETIGVAFAYATEEPTHLARPRHSSEFVDGGD
ncbi:hypothetical protein D3C83_256670 [compost metagenome]